MATRNTDFLRFSAYSMKDLITRKLSEDSRFTDQIYEGSNLAILIDIISYMYQCLIYNLNNAAAESMFADTQIYENINRLCKFIGYHPDSCGSMTAEFKLDDGLSENSYILKYAFLDTGLYDDNGKKIYYSTSESSTVNTNQPYITTLVNGKWKLYHTTFTSSGDQYQKFILDDLKSDEDDNRFVPSDGIHVYIQEDPVTDKLKVIQYEMVDEGIFTDNKIENGANIYTSNDTIFDLRLNENKTYEITFGNGYTGKIPPKGSLIYIMYLDGNGPSGKISTNQVVNKELKCSATDLGMSAELFNAIQFQPDIGDRDEFKFGTWTNTTNSSNFVSEESVSDIQINAPEWFKTGNRLVTNFDYEYYFKNRNRAFIIDAVCQNNWEYISTLYRWLYNLGLNGNYTQLGNESNPQNAKRLPAPNYYINQNILMKYDFKWADAADVNNVYMWLKMRNDSELMKQKFDADIKNIKTLTQEVVYLKPVIVEFSPCAESITTAIQYFSSDNSTSFDPNNNSYIEITLDDNCVYTNVDMTIQVANVIRTYFDENSMTLGMLVDFSELSKRIYDLGAITRIRTIYYNPDDGSTIIQPGLCFATWSSVLIDLGDDLTISNTSRSLEAFQFPRLYNSALIQNKIKVIRKTINNINSVQY